MLLSRALSRMPAMATRTPMRAAPFRRFSTEAASSTEGTTPPKPETYGALIGTLHWLTAGTVLSGIGCLYAGWTAGSNTKAWRKAWVDENFSINGEAGKKPTSELESLGGDKYVAKQVEPQEFLGLKQGRWMFFHKSFGVATFFLMLPRVGLRVRGMLRGTLPGKVPGTNGVEHVLANLGHLGMYGFLIVMPTTGVFMGAFNGNGLPFFNQTIKFPWEKQGWLAGGAFSIHKQVGSVGQYLVPLHMGAAGLHVARGHKVMGRISPLG